MQVLEKFVVGNRIPDRSKFSPQLDCGEVLFVFSVQLVGVADTEIQAAGEVGDEAVYGIHVLSVDA